MAINPGVVKKLLNTVSPEARLIAELTGENPLRKVKFAPLKGKVVKVKKALKENSPTAENAAEDAIEQTADVGAPQSGGDYNPIKALQIMAKNEKLSKSERQKYKRLYDSLKNWNTVAAKGTDKQFRKELGRRGIEVRDGVKREDYRQDILNKLSEQELNGPTLGDKFIAHHGVGLTGLGIVGVSTLDLANSRGQQSNAQLYSDPFA